jgi:hypothetical protein
LTFQYDEGDGPAWHILLLAALTLVFTSYLVIFVWLRVGAPATPSRPASIINKGDFPYFYSAADAMLHGEDIYTAHPPTLDAGYLYPPLVAFLYQPLIKIGPIWGARVSLLINVSALALAMALMARSILYRFGYYRWRTVWTVAVLAAFLETDKIKSEVQMLQTNGLVALALAIGLFLLESSPIGVGAALGFAINIKYQAAICLLYLCFRRQWVAVGATFIWTVIWSLLPAWSVGFQQNASYLARSLGGVLNLFGISAGDDRSAVLPLDSHFSVSITSAAARLVEHTGMGISPFLIAAMIAFIWLALGMSIYRAMEMPFLSFAGQSDRKRAPWLAITAIEWVIIISGVLAFSPQTNMRHMVLTTFVATLGFTLLLESRGRYRALTAIALAVLWCGLNLPPGKNGSSPGTLTSLWLDIGGPSWTLLIASLLLAYVGLTVAKRQVTVIE